MRPVRKIFDALESHQDGRTTHTLLILNCSMPDLADTLPISPNMCFSPAENTDMPAIQLETVATADFLEVIAHTKPSARNLMDRYTAWEKEYESV